jgi:hypothetical protein
VAWLPCSLDGYHLPKGKWPLGHLPDMHAPPRPGPPCPRRRPSPALARCRLPALFRAIGEPWLWFGCLQPLIDELQRQLTRPVEPSSSPKRDEEETIGLI